MYLIKIYIFERRRPGGYPGEIMKKPVIVSAVRTAGGRFGGGLSSLSAGDLGAAVVAEVVKRAGISGEDVDQLIFGCGWQASIS